MSASTGEPSHTAVRGVPVPSPARPACRWRGIGDPHDIDVTGAARDAAVRAAAALRRRRADAVHVDALTGLPGPEAWRRMLPVLRARDRGALWVATARLEDHLRPFELPATGPADDRLRDTVGAWSSVMRREDVLARLGPAEFGLAIHAGRLSTVLRVLERVRATTPSGLTCTMGVTRCDGDETADDAMLRSRHALEHGLDAGGARVAVALTR